MSMLPNGLNLLPIGSGGTVTVAPSWNDVATSSYAPKEYVIQGQMYTTKMVIDNTQINAMQAPVNPDDIKMQLCNQIAEELWKNKAIEFTKREDPMTGTHTFHARIYAVPDTMVRILRENGK